MFLFLFIQLFTIPFIRADMRNKNHGAKKYACPTTCNCVADPTKQVSCPIIFCPSENDTSYLSRGVGDITPPCQNTLLIFFRFRVTGIIVEVSAEIAEFSVGQVIDSKYEVVSVLGEGAMGIVYEGLHLRLHKRVAIKTLRAEIADAAGLIERFQQEARAASAIGHPNICEVFDLGTVNNAHFMVMEFLLGQNLADQLKQTPTLEYDHAHNILAEVLSALAAAHELGIVHRDLKPENIFLATTKNSQQSVKLLDFGISKILAKADAHLSSPSGFRTTQVGTILGTPLYMSPEQARGEENIDHRADIWAAGCVLYEILCGRTPFVGDNYNQILSSILHGKFPHPRQLRSGIPRNTEQAILRALAQDRDNRFTSASEMRQFLLDNDWDEPSTASRLLYEADHAVASDEFQREEKSFLNAFDKLTTAEQFQMTAIDGQEDLSAAHTSGSGSIRKSDIALALDSRGGTARDRPSAVRLDIAPDLSSIRAKASSVHPKRAPAGTPRPVTNDTLQRLAPIRPTPETRTAPGKTDSPPLQPSPRSHRPHTSRYEKKLIFAMAFVAVGALAYGVYLALSRNNVSQALLQFEIIPEDASILVDKKGVFDKQFSIETGVAYELDFHKTGHLSVHQIVTPKHTRTISIYLPHQLLPLADPKNARAPPFPSPSLQRLTQSQTSAGLTALGMLSTCLIKLHSLHDVARKRIRQAITSLRAKSSAKLQSLSRGPIQQCQAAYQHALAHPPLAPSLQPIATEPLQALNALDALLEELPELLGADQLALAQKFASGVRHSATESRHMLAAVVSIRIHWEEQDLAMLAQRGGQNTHWHLRKLVLESQRWTWMLLTRGAKQLSEKLHHLMETNQQAREYVTRPDSQPIAGMQTLLETAEDLIKQGQKLRSKTLSKQKKESIRLKHNKLVTLYNKLVL